jgi:hypothetical protein
LKDRTLANFYRCPFYSNSYSVTNFYRCPFYSNSILFKFYSRFGDLGAFLGLILGVGPLAGIRNSHSRCGSVVNSAFDASCWHSKFASSLRNPSQFINFKRFPCTQNSHSRCGIQANYKFQAFPTHTKFASSLWNPSKL